MGMLWCRGMPLLQYTPQLSPFNPTTALYANMFLSVEPVHIIVYCNVLPSLLFHGWIALRAFSLLNMPLKQHLLASVGTFRAATYLGFMQEGRGMESVGLEMEVLQWGPGAQICCSTNLLISELFL